MSVELQSTSSDHSLAVKAPGGSPRAFIVLFVLTFVVIFGGSLALNIITNPRATFPNAAHPPHTDRAGHCREFESLVQAGKPPQVIILGSSRTMQIRPFQIEKITGKRTFNFGVGGATPLDSLTQLKYVLAQGVKPQMVILGVDQDEFNADHNEFEFGLFTHWKLFQQVPFPENLTVAISVLKTVSPESTYKAMQAVLPYKLLTAVGLQKKKPVRKPGAVVVDHVMIENGYFIYSTRAKQLAEGDYKLESEIAGAVRKWASAPVEKQHITVADRLWRRFEQFIDLARQNGIELKIMLLPVNPEYERLALKSGVVAERAQLSQRIAALCESRGVTYRDFSNVKSYSGDPKAFWDHVHQQPDNLSRMINTLFDLPPNTYLHRPSPDALPTDVELLSRLKKDSKLER